MPSLTELARSHAGLGEDDVEWLHRLLGDWQLLADLSFADLVLWLPGARPADGFVAAAQMRPTTGPTVHHDDIVGTRLPPGRRPQLDSALAEARICRERDPDWPGNVPVREETIPVIRAGRVIAVISRHTDLAAARTPSRLELTYLRTADDLALMIAQGRFPLPAGEGPQEGGPRVGDGLVRLDEAGQVSFASPNALSAYRRLGLTADLSGRHLGQLTAALVGDGAPVHEALSMLVSGRAARQTDVEAAGATVRLRVIPLIPGGVPAGALVLLRDVTELRRRERELVSKDVTIREIHHRVKNNLQTVAALLRLQGRRLAGSDETARAALLEAERRVGSIALVHETLSRTLDERVDFDEVADRVGALVGEVGGGPRGDTTSYDVAGEGVRVVRRGDFGPLGPEVATPLAVALVELVQNSAEHGLGPRGGCVLIDVRRDDTRLRLTVSEEPSGARPAPRPATQPGGTGLGLQIVRTLVEGELGGTLSMTGSADSGVRVAVELPLS